MEDSKVSENCEVLFRNHEWLPLEWLITKKSFGDDVKLKILRKNTDMNTASEVYVNIKLNTPNHLIPRILNVDYHPYWVIIGQ